MIENLLLNQPVESYSNCSGVEINGKTVAYFPGTRQKHKYFLFAGDFNWVMNNPLKERTETLGLIYIYFYTGIV